MRTTSCRFPFLIILLVVVFFLSSCKSLTKCAISGDNRCLDELIGKGEDINKHDQWGWTPLLWAVYYGNLETVQFLITKGANVNARTMDDYMSVYKDSTPLIIASKYENADIAGLLIKNGAVVNHKNRKGQNAYSIAHRNKSAPILALLGKGSTGKTSLKTEENAIEGVSNEPRGSGEIIIQLNDGRRIVGKVLTHTRKDVTVRTKQNTIVVDKDKIMKFAY